MAQTTVQLPWGNDVLSVTLPESWHVAGTLRPAVVPAHADPKSAVHLALGMPQGSPTIRSLAGALGAGATVAIVIDDDSRPTPVAIILPAVLAELQRAGIAESQITMVPALGVHRPMTSEESCRRAGVQPGSVAFENPDCDDKAKQVNLGTTSRGTPVWINRTVAEASLVVAIGCIEPHIIASFGGGYKNIVPGVAGRETIAHNHALNCAPDTFNMVGQPIDKNPMRLDLEEAAGMLAKQPHQPKFFLVNAILNHCKEVVRIVAGEPVAAHRAGVQASAGLYGVRVKQPADVVLTCSAPMDQDLRQGVKALANTVRAVRPGGAMVTFVRAEEGVGVFGLANRKLPLGRSALRAAAPLLLKLVPKMKLNGMGEEDRFFLYFALQAMRHARLILYAPTIPQEIHERLPFVTFAPTPEAAIQMAAETVKGPAETLVFPHGGITYPNLG